MFCRKCGNKLEEGSAFCNYCGTQVITDKPSEEKEVIAEQEPVQEDVAKEVPSNTAKRSMKLPLIIGLGAAAVALVAGVVIFKPFGLFKTGTNDDGTIAESDIGETASETAIETQVPSEEIRAAAYAGYLGILEANENAIRSCVAFDSYDCALADVTGDGIEDLVITTVGSYPAYGTIDVYSYTVSTNSANNILRLEDIYPTGQMGDVFVAVSDDGQLVVYHDGVGSQAENYYYDIYEYDGNSLNSVNTIKFDTSEYTQSTYTINNEAVTQDVFNSNLTDMIDSIDKLLQHTPENGDFSGWFEPAYDVISSMDSIAMTYDNMHSYLVSNRGSDTLTNDQDAVQSAAYASYLDILEAHHTDIESGEVFNYYNCALADVTHDGIDDLVFTTVGPVLNAADLYVYSYDPITGLANCILYEEGFYWIGGGGTVAMVAVSNTGDLITCSEGYGSAYYDFYTYNVYSFDGVSLTMQDSFYYELYDNSFDTPEMGSELIETYKHNDVDISQSEFSNSEMLLTGSISTLLQCSEGLQDYPSFHEQLHNAIAPLDSIAVTYDDMHALLASYI